jgi:hypothetical protein
MHLAAEIDAASEWLSGVMQEGIPSHSEARRRLPHNAQGVIPQVLLSAEPASKIALGFSEDGAEFGNSDM